MSIRITTPTKSYVTHYPEINEMADTQNDIFWTHNEINVEKDLHDLRTDFTEAEYHGVVTTLKLFTLYELIAGNEYWGDRFVKMFPRPEFQRLGSCFSHFELNVHAPFYDKINKVLGLDTEEFYTDYVDDKNLRDRMSFIDSCVNHENDLVSLGAFSLVEGAILYSSFAFLKHFQSEGKNKLTNVTAGINFSVRDEALHSEAGAYVFKLYQKELEEAGNGLSVKDKKALAKEMYKIADTILKHEKRIIEMIFEKGRIVGITDNQMINFVESRLDVCLENLGLEKRYKPEYNPIASWFYKNIGGGQFHDFFHKVGSEYRRGWDERAFKW